jgi:hypothetical protein
MQDEAFIPHAIERAGQRGGRRDDERRNPPGAHQDFHCQGKGREADDPGGCRSQGR